MNALSFCVARLFTHVLCVSLVSFNLSFAYQTCHVTYLPNPSCHVGEQEETRLWANEHVEFSLLHLL